jgi:hypothetical protein
MKDRFLTLKVTLPRQDSKMAFGDWVDKSIKPIGTCSLVVGTVAAAAGIASASSYLLATGVLCHVVSRFGDWWKKT